jgi:dihydrofolate reductase
MRKIVAGLFATVDGVVDFAGEFVGGFMNEEVGQDMAVQSAARDAILLGRQTYQEMSGYWPAQGDENPIAAEMNSKPKLVVSSTLESVDEWQNSTLIKGNPVEELERLKQEPGGNIFIVGSLTLAESLLRAGVVDEVYLLVFPVVLGRGRRLFEGDGDPVRLELTESRAFSNGAIRNIYAPANQEAADA